MKPSVLNIESPIQEEMFAEADERADVQFHVRPDDANPQASYQSLAAILEKHPDMTLRVYGENIDDLDFLKFFPKLRRFDFRCGPSTKVEDLEGLKYLPADVVYLGILMRRRISLRIIERFAALQEFYLDGNPRDIEVISRFSALKKLTLRSVTLPNLSILRSLHELWRLKIKLGGLKDLSPLGQVGQIRYLELWLIRGPEDISPIGDMTTLQHLFLQSLKHVQQLPNLERLTQLRRVDLEDMKGIADLSPLLGAKSLEYLTCVNMGHLKATGFECLRRHPPLKRVLAGLCSFRKNREVDTMLGMPWAESCDEEVFNLG